MRQQPPQKMRFRLNLPLTFSWTAGHDRQAGAGTIQEIGSDAVVFAYNQSPPPLAILTLSVAWPVRLEDGCRLRLFLFGRGVAAGERLFAVDIERYEFRTAPRDEREAELRSPSEVFGAVIDLGTHAY